MFDSDQDQRVLPASSRRRADARQAGSVPRSPDVAATLVLIVFTFGLVLFGPELLTAGRELISGTLAHPQTGKAHAVLLEPSFAALRFCRIAVGWLLIAAVAAVIGNVLQFGLLFAPRVIQPDPERLGIQRGLQRVLSGCHPRAMFLNCARLATIAVISGWLIWSIWPLLAAPAQSTPGSVFAEFADAVIMLGACLAGGTIVISLLMAIAERLRHEARLRMTLREAREERRMNEADPAVVHRRRETGQQRVASIMRPPTAGRHH